MHAVDLDLRATLRMCPPLSALDEAELDRAAERAKVVAFGAGELVLDAFKKESTEVDVVVSGRVELWNAPDLEEPDEVVEAGGLFGFTSMLTDTTIGPRAVAATDAVVARIPASAVRSAFISIEGARFLAARLAGAHRGRTSTVDDTIVRSPLGGRLLAARSLKELRKHASRMPDVLAELVAQGLAPARVIAFHSAMVDTVCRRTLQLVFAEHPDLTLDDFTWLSLGSNGRREAVPSSDLDAAVVFRDSVPAPYIARYREVFGEVTDALATAGLASDSHGTTPTRQLFARTSSGWRSAARHWLADPTRNNGAMMTSLLVDGRPIHGDPSLPAVSRVFADLREHPGTMHLLLRESLSRRARTHTVGALLRRSGRDGFDIKTHALLPIVNLARWVALAHGSRALSTVERLADVEGSQVLPSGRARTLAEVFEVLQGIRLRYQLAQIERGERPDDVLAHDRLSAIDHSIITRAVREIAAAQKRADNIAAYVPTDQWVLPEDGS